MYLYAYACTCTCVFTWFVYCLPHTHVCVYIYMHTYVYSQLCFIGSHTYVLIGSVNVSCEFYICLYGLCVRLLQVVTGLHSLLLFAFMHRISFIVSVCRWLKSLGFASAMSPSLSECDAGGEGLCSCNPCKACCSSGE